jgi:hypothetical protein
MKVEFEKIRIITDERQFIVQEKKVVQESELTKAENVGNEYWKDLAYCRTLNYALKYLCKREVLANHDLKVILQRIKLIEAKIDEMTKVLNEDESC